eukprot:SAG22_NODE_1673_length_3836_cov_3.441263_2_plen_51_part_00
MGEVVDFLKFMEYVYDVFGMSFNLMLSTRCVQWNRKERQRNRRKGSDHCL